MSQERCVNCNAMMQTMFGSSGNPTPNGFPNPAIFLSACPNCQLVKIITDSFVIIETIKKESIEERNYRK